MLSNIIADNLIERISLNKDDENFEFNKLFIEKEKLDLDENDANNIEKKSVEEIVKSIHNIENNIFDYNNNRNGIEVKEINIDNINSIKLGKISKIESHEFKKNINSENSENLFIYFNQSEKKFSFYNHSNNYIGSFTLFELLKYISEPFDQKNKFLDIVLTNNESFQKAKYIINLFIFRKFNYLNKIKYLELKLHDYQTSAFMGDIELIMRLNKLLYEFESIHLENELQYVDEKNRGNIKQIIKKFIFMLLNYTIQLFSIVSEDIKNNLNISSNVKNQIIKYTIGTLYKLSNYVQYELNKNLSKQKNYISLMESSNILKKKLDDKLDIITQLLKETTENKQQENYKIISDPKISSSILEENSKQKSEENFNAIYYL
ncbi:Hypothetical protein KVN_LOCUS492 [uncultured virus]|nr:Hypothetical protein KVN_LOCUS492 [uncultured virus]